MYPDLQATEKGDSSPSFERKSKWKKFALLAAAAVVTCVLVVAGYHWMFSVSRVPAEVTKTSKGPKHSTAIFGKKCHVKPVPEGQIDTKSADQSTYFSAAYFRAFFSLQKVESEPIFTTDSFTGTDWNSFLAKYSETMHIDGFKYENINNLEVLMGLATSKSVYSQKLEYPFLLEVACRLGTVEYQKLKAAIAKVRDISRLYGEPCHCLFNLLSGERKEESAGKMTRLFAHNQYFSSNNVQDVAFNEGIEARTLALIAYKAGRSTVFERAVQMIAEDSDFGTEELANLLIDLCEEHDDISSEKGLKMIRWFLDEISKRDDIQDIIDASRTGSGPNSLITAIKKGDSGRKAVLTRDKKLTLLISDFLRNFARK